MMPMHQKAIGSLKELRDMHPSHQKRLSESWRRGVYIVAITFIACFSLSFVHSRIYGRRQQSELIGLGTGYSSVANAPDQILFLRGDEIRCNNIVLDSDLNSSCNLDWGWRLFEDWHENHKLVIDRGSVVKCSISIGTYSFCRFSNVTIDFSKATQKDRVRVFTKGFFTTHGVMRDSKLKFDIPGRLHNEEDSVKGDDNLETLKEYEVVERRPTSIISNDDIFNLGHYINDVMNVWQMSMLAGRNMKNSLLINFDGFRMSGPAGGAAHRLMVPSDVDCYGPYNNYYESWFSEIKKAVHYRDQRVRFSELYLPSNPYFPWFWNDWRKESACALRQSSPLYQSFNLFLRNRWREKYGLESLPQPDLDRVHVVVEVRPIDLNKTDEHSSARHIKNIADLVAALKNIPNARVTAQDFTKIPFEKQVALSHSAGVFVSMHGAGTTHIFHSALGAPNCCALVELQPEERLGYRHTVGYANLARMHGLHYYRYTASAGRTAPTGTSVRVEEVAAIVAEAAAAVSRAPTCLGDVRDTRDPGLLGFKWL